MIHDMIMIYSCIHYFIYKQKQYCSMCFSTCCFHTTFVFLCISYIKVLHGNICIINPYGKMIHFDGRFSKWVGTTT